MTFDDGRVSDDGKHSGEEGVTTLLARNERPLESTPREGTQQTVDPSTRWISLWSCRTIGFAGSAHCAHADWNSPENAFALHKSEVARFGGSPLRGLGRTDWGVRENFDCTPHRADGSKP